MKIELSDQDVGLILAALGKLPLEISLDTWTRVRMQYAQETKAQQAKVDDAALKAKVAKANGEDAEVQELIKAEGAQNGLS